MAAPITWQRGIWIIGIIPLGLSLAGLGAIIGLGNPQWHPRIYIFQAYTLNRTLTPPPRYTGEWRDWNRVGQLTSRASYRAGTRKEFTRWSTNGTLAEQGWITARGVHLGIKHLYHPNGAPAAEFQTRGQYRYGKASWWDQRGSKIAEGTYVNERRWEGTFLLYDEISRNHIVEHYSEGSLLTQRLLGAQLSERAHD